MQVILFEGIRTGCPVDWMTLITLVIPLFGLLGGPC